MKFKQANAELFAPDGASAEKALARTTHMAIGAHQDDLEIMAFHGILECFQLADAWYTGIVVSNGSGAPRAGRYADISDEDMVVVRRREQKKAALVGDYSAQLLLDYPSSAIKSGEDTDIIEEFKAILLAAKPRFIYTHNLADKHDTHVGVALKVIAALRDLLPDYKPEAVYGCEVWRDLDWLVDNRKVIFDVSEHENLQAALLGVFDSQVAGGKRYDLATLGRRRANATFGASHAVDVSTGVTYGMDLMPLLDNPDAPPLSLVEAHLEFLRAEVAERIARMS